MMKRSTPPLSRLHCGLALVGIIAATACSSDLGGAEGGETEIITTVTLSFEPRAGGETIIVSFSDPDGDGGVSGSADPLVLDVGESYELRVAFTNELVDPPEEITPEVEEEAEEHQLLFTGIGLSGPAAGQDPDAIAVHGYADVESDYGDNQGEDLPVGLVNEFVAMKAGMGTLVVRLQHLPELNGAPQKVAGLAEEWAAGMPLPGDPDAAVEFEMTLQ